MTYLSDIKQAVIDILQFNISKHPSLEISMCIKAEFVKPNDPNVLEYNTFNLKKVNEPIYQPTELGDYVEDMSRKIPVEKSECEIT